MNNCKKCKFWNRKKVMRPGGCGMCENRHSENHKMVTGIKFECPDFKKGNFSKKFIILLTQ